MRLNAPDLNSRRTRLADWLELRALTSATQQASVSDIRSQLRRTSDGRGSPKDFDIDADDNGEPEITDRTADDLEERVCDELTFRQETIGDSYPFALVNSPDGRSNRLHLKSTWHNITSGELIYVFCLLDSGIRDALISVAKGERALVQSIGNVFQICACIAVGGYIDAEVVSFGFPRATGTGFLPALQAAWARYGSYSIATHSQHGFGEKLKDGGVDIIAWRHFHDRLAGTLIMFVQVASGLDWKEKTIVEDVKEIRQWFTGVRFEHFLPAICIPFPLWFDLDEPPTDNMGNAVAFNDGISTRFMYREAKFGVIFDRGRMARCCALLLARAGGISPNIDGLDRVHEINQWVDSVMSVLGEIRSRE
jgi:hypothetical protein